MHDLGRKKIGAIDIGGATHWHPPPPPRGHLDPGVHVSEPPHDKPTGSPERLGLVDSVLPSGLLFARTCDVDLPPVVSLSSPALSGLAVQVGGKTRGTRLIFRWGEVRGGLIYLRHKHGITRWSYTGDRCVPFTKCPVGRESRPEAPLIESSLCTYSPPQARAPIARLETCFRIFFPLQSFFSSFSCSLSLFFFFPVVVSPSMLQADND